MILGKPSRFEERSVVGAEEALREMTGDEKAALLAGVDDWHIRGVPRLGIPGMRVTDCGHGVTLVGDDAVPATCFPTGVGMASTWNPELLEQVGMVLAAECRALGCGMLLGPKLNIHRVPLNGRSFETFSEDPWLAGVLGAALVRGIQRGGVAACVKALVANNQQTDQQQVSSRVSERALREIYLRPFELVLEWAEPAAMMTSYNRVNGDFAAENRWLITQVIKREWRFRGLVVSDWRSVQTDKVYRSGLDLEMPGPGTFFRAQVVRRALREGLLSAEDVDDKVGRILRVLFGYAEPLTPGAVDTPGHRQCALEAAEESIVLLKNTCLPLDRNGAGRILVTGPNARDARLGGGGSASVTPPYSVSPLEGIRRLCGEHLQVDYIEGCSIQGEMETMEGCFRHEAGGRMVAGLRTEFFNDGDPVGDPVAAPPTHRMDYSWGWASPCPGVRRGLFAVRFSGEIVPEHTGPGRLGVFAQEGGLRVWIDGRLVVDEWMGADGNFESAYRTHYRTVDVAMERLRPIPVVVEYGKRAARAAVRMEWELPNAPHGVAKAVEAARGADTVIICAGLSNLLEGGAHDRDSMDLPAVQERLIREIARVNPRTVVVLNNGGPVLMPWAEDVAAVLEAWYPGQEGGNALARILFGLTNPSGKLPDTLPRSASDVRALAHYPGDGSEVAYEEELMVGYRHFDHAGIEPHFPFGFGLSYTTFTVSAPIVPEARFSVDDGLGFAVRVENTGARPGKVVVQIYVREERAPDDHPLRQLRAFRKIHLEPGEHRIVPFRLERLHFERFDPEFRKWICRPGIYEIVAGQHSRDGRGTRVELA